MVIDKFLIIGRRGKVRLATRRVSVSNAEIMIKLRINISEQVFNRMTPTAELEINNQNAILPMSVEIDNFDELEQNPNRQSQNQRRNQ